MTVIVNDPLKIVFREYVLLNTIINSITVVMFRVGLPCTLQLIFVITIFSEDTNEKE